MHSWNPTVDLITGERASEQNIASWLAEITQTKRNNGVNQHSQWYTYKMKGDKVVNRNHFHGFFYG